MIVVANNNGQTCNRLVLFARTLATALQTHQSLVFLFGMDVRQTLDISCGRVAGIRVRCFRWSGRSTMRAILLVLHWVGIHPFCPERRRAFSKRLPALLGKMAGRPNRFHPVFMWDFRNDDALFRFQSILVSKFPFRPEHLQRPGRFCELLRRSFSCLVGVHIRRGDYRTFHNGKYYYDDDTYARFMLSFSKSFERPVAFCVCSNEQIRSEAFGELIRNNVFVMDDNSMYEDLALLSLCDYVMGPPSTFSWCAAYWGQKPYLPIYAQQEDCNRSRFELHASVPMP